MTFRGEGIISLLLIFHCKSKVSYLFNFMMWILSLSLNHQFQASARHGPGLAIATVMKEDVGPGLLESVV